MQVTAMSAATEFRKDKCVSLGIAAGGPATGAVPDCFLGQQAVSHLAPRVVVTKHVTCIDRV